MKINERYEKKQHDLSNKAVYPKFPRIIKIDICNICNYACIFCPQAKQRGSDKKGCIDEKLFYHVVKDAYNAGAREICLSATGEPLVNNNLEKYVQFVHDLGYEYIFFYTNGYLLTEERSKKIIDAGVDSVKFSINAGRKNYSLIHGVDGYDVVIENLKYFNDYRKLAKIKTGKECALSVSYIATAATLDEVDDVKKDVLPYVDDFMVMNANNRGGSASEAEDKLFIGNDKYSYTYPCSQIFNNVYVTAEGYMVTCCQDFENLTVVADLSKESVVDGWNNETFTNFRRKYLNHDLDGTLCVNCLGINSNAEVIPICSDKAYYPIDENKEKDLNDRIEKLYEQIRKN